MGIPRRLLREREEIIFDVHPHWTLFGGPAAGVVLAIIGLIVSLVTAPAIFSWLVLGIVLMLMLGTLARVLRWYFTNFCLTTDRIIFRTGILSKHGVEIPLDRVTNIAYYQTLVGRLLNAGDLLIESAGEEGQEYFHNIGNPERLQQLVYAEMEELEIRDAQRVAGAVDHGPGGNGRTAQRSVPEQIRELAELRQQGYITDDEFQAKKRQLLDRM